MRFLIILLLAFSATAGEQPEKAAAKKDTETAGSQSSEEKSPQKEVSERLQVLGSAEQAHKTPGSAHYLSKEDLEEQQYSDIHRILRQVPGVYIQEEDGLGLRPNIGFRGTGVERSSKITLMEDGVLIAPAPYTAPSAYYFPTAGRMENVEVLKGPSTVSQGPFTNGGSLNMVSTSIPGDFAANITGAAGSHGTRRLKANVGNSGERFGWLVETFRLDSDGFKDLDGGGDTGVDLEDYLAKFRFSSSASASVYHSFEIKLSKTEQLGDETYLGLTEADFQNTPYRRYAGSQNDYIDTDHEQVQLHYYVKPSNTMDISTVVYHNDYYRNWHKMEKTMGVSNATILANPEQYANHLAIIKGEVDSGDDALRIRNNNRNYLSEGIQTKLTWSPETSGSVSHDLEFSLRYHEDEEDRLQHEEDYRITAGAMILTSEGAPGSQTNRLSTAEAFSGYITDTISTGNWTFRPGVRFEQIDYTRFDYSTANPSRDQGPTRVRENGVDVVLPSLGVDYVYANNSRVFAGIYRGFSPPGAGKNEDTREEESTNFELGLRHSAKWGFLELTSFFNDYDNLLGAETVSGGGDTIGELFNGGEVEVRGLEAAFSTELAKGSGWSVPLSFNYTYTDSEFQTTFESGFADWSPLVEAGDELPYIPKQQYHLNLGLVMNQWSIHTVLDWSDEMRTKAGQGTIPEGEGTEDRTVVDLAADYRFGKRFKVFTQIRNAFDETYIVARRPYGVRPGLKRTLMIGASANF